MPRPPKAPTAPDSRAASLREALEPLIAGFCRTDWGKSPAQIGNAFGPALASVTSLLARQLSRPLLAVLPGPAARDSLLMDLDVFDPEMEVIDLPTEELRGERRAQKLADWLPSLRSLLALPKNQPALVCATLPALVSPLPDDRNLRESMLTLKVGQEYGPQKLEALLDSNGYEPVPEIEFPGQFSRRGGIFDLWPHAEPAPIRLDFFGDDIEEIRSFDVATQRSLARMKTISFPLLSASAGEGNDAHDEEYLGGLLTYLPPDTMPLFIERRESLLRLEGMRPFMRGKEKSARLGALDTLFNQVPRIEVDGSSFMERRGAINLDLTAIPRLSGGTDAGMRVLNELIKDGLQIELHCGSSGEVQRLEAVLQSHGVAMAGLELLPSEISASFKLPKSGLAIVSGADLLGKERLRHGVLADEESLASLPHRAIDDFVSLDTGDFVVHVEHGIARYKGIEELRSPDGSRGEFLNLEFEGGTEIHVPVTNADVVQKYIGTRGLAPKLSKYQGKGWSEKKARVQSAVLQLAADMLRLQALRLTESGYAYPAADEMVHDFVESFPYRDTPDQEKAWDDIQRDMTSARPMDRLLCGDVGFGKTEVAMRAAFRAATAGRQVAVLVPTTVLCQQHLISFRERMKDYPVRVEMLSRFRTPAEQQATIRRLRSGECDIVIGTHRLVSPDVGFKDLGLFIIDEEQRFGVEHKESIKKLRETVDVLTLSATPIPRTLHMALLGLRDISTLTTPPQHRHPVETQAKKWNDTFIAEAIRAELAREGQIYFVHNRVQDIKDIAARIATMVPEARVAVGHGQMPERELEAVMMRFIRHEIDVFVCTTIIESGIDVRAANTMFIDQANRYGLADLHQLRGRVGRYKHRAYCYLILPNEGNVKELAEKRLRALLQHTSLGSGFHIAMRDLEIRGAGNIIGHEQSGHIASVGYDLYCQMLERAVRQLKGGRVINEVETYLDLDVNLVLPRNYIKDKTQRAQAYRLMARCRSTAQADAVRIELKDRYGKLPAQAETFLTASLVRHRIGQLGIHAVTTGRGLKDLPAFFKFKAISANATYVRLKDAVPGLRLIDESTLALPMGRGLDRADDQLKYLYNLTQSLVHKGIVMNPEDVEAPPEDSDSSEGRANKAPARSAKSAPVEATTPATAAAGPKVRVKPRRQS